MRRRSGSAAFEGAERGGADRVGVDVVVAIEVRASARLAEPVHAQRNHGDPVNPTEERQSVGGAVGHRHDWGGLFRRRDQAVQRPHVALGHRRIEPVGARDRQDVGGHALLMQHLGRRNCLGNDRPGRRYLYRQFRIDVSAVRRDVDQPVASGQYVPS